jgi:hypothetical protein
MVKFTLKDGSEINVKPFYSAKIDDAEPRQALLTGLCKMVMKSIIKQEFNGQG